MMLAVWLVPLAVTALALLALARMASPADRPASSDGEDKPLAAGR